ncbi:MAG: DUF456 domain-containing protein [Chloroflexota bacterium]|nr:DUF456 domain-containing protein [Chloroflexota bacterium]
MPQEYGISLLAYLLIFFGLIGSVLPILPGPLLIWLGILVWAWNDGFNTIGWPILLFLGILTVLAWGTDLALTTMLSRRSGVSWKAILGAIGGGIAGGILLGGWIPIIGTLIATMVGAVVGTLFIEFLDKRNLPAALRASRTYILGYLASSALEAILALAMVAIFIWQAFLS